METRSKALIFLLVIGIIGAHCYVEEKGDRYEGRARRSPEAPYKAYKEAEIENQDRHEQNVNAANQLLHDPVAEARRERLALFRQRVNALVAQGVTRMDAEGQVMEEFARERENGAGPAPRRRRRSPEAPYKAYKEAEIENQDRHEQNVNAANQLLHDPVAEARRERLALFRQRVNALVAQGVTRMDAEGQVMEEFARERENAA